MFPYRGTFRLKGDDFMPKTETIRARVDAELKAHAEGVLAKLGLNASEAIRLFHKQVALRDGLPFDVKLPNATTSQALTEADAGENLIHHDCFDDFSRTMTGE